MDRAVTRRRLTLRHFVQRRLGDGTDLDQLRNMINRSFGAGSLASFWHYWNPVYSYYLNRFCYRPLRRVLPRPIAVLVTFACSGFLLHDLPFWWGVTALKTHSLPIPFVALWFSLIAIMVLGGARLGLDFSAQRVVVRALLNVLHIAVAGLLAYAIIMLVR